MLAMSIWRNENTQQLIEKYSVSKAALTSTQRPAHE
jgi:hypothetical protein